MSEINTYNKITTLIEELNGKPDRETMFRLKTLLAYAYVVQQPEDLVNGAICGTEALHLLEDIKAPNPEYVGTLYLTMGIISQYNLSYKVAYNYIHNAIQVLGPLEDSESQVLLATAWNVKGIILKQKGDISDALKAYQKAEHIYKKQNRPGKVAAILNNKGVTLEIENRAYEALKCYAEALEYADRAKDLKTQVSLKVNIAALLVKVNKVGAAQRYLGECLDMLPENDHFRLALIYRAYASAYWTENKFHKAIFHINKALEYAQKSGIIHAILVCQEYALGIYVDGKLYQQGMVYAHEILLSSRQVNVPVMTLGRVYTYIAQCILEDETYPQYFKQYDTISRFIDQPKEIFDNILVFIDKMERIDLVRLGIECVAKYYEKVGNYKEAMKHYKSLANDFTEEYKNSKEQMLFRFYEEIEKDKNQEALNHQIQLLEQQQEISKQLKTFAHSVSHDLKSPLRTINGYSQLVLKRAKGKLDDNSIADLKTIIDTTSNMADLITNLLQLSKGDAGKVTTEMVNLNKVLYTIMQNLSVALMECSGLIKYTELPKIRGIKSFMVQLFQNLISNALKYRKKEEPPIIEVTYEDHQEHYHFCIKDNGIGIAADKIDLIFKPYTQLNEETEGSGIGLATCSKIVQLIGGEIWVKSVEGEGSEFWFSIRKDDH